MPELIRKNCELGQTELPARAGRWGTCAAPLLCTNHWTTFSFGSFLALVYMLCLVGEKKCLASSESISVLLDFQINLLYLLWQIPTGWHFGELFV